jgi:PhnB protein
MTNEVRSLLEGYLPVIHYFCCKDAAANIECYKTAFGATELESMRIAAPDGKIGHTEIRIGNASIMITNEFPKYNMRSPRSIGGSPVSISFSTSIMLMELQDGLWLLELRQWSR